MTDKFATSSTAAEPEHAPDPALRRRTFLGGGAALAGATAATLVLAEPAAATQNGSAQLLDSLPSARDIPRRSRIVDYEIAELIVLLRARRLTSVELTRAYLERIDRFNGPFETYGDNGAYNAFVRIDRDGALAQAAAADKLFRKGSHASVPPLCGIPFGIKDSVGVRGLEAKNGTHAYDGNVAYRDATVVAKLRAQGAVIIGHTIASAFSGSISGTFAGNAWNPRFVPGGSSQGSGVATAARLAAATIGEETGGSIMMPASANGASAIKPSLGLVSTAGVMPLSPGYDVLGPIARSVRDASLVLTAILGPDPAPDPLTLSAPNPFPTLPVAARKGRYPLAGVTIGIPQTDWMTAGGTGTPPAGTYDVDYRAAFERFKRELAGLGARVKEFPGLDVTVPENDPYFRTTDRLPVPVGDPVSPATAVLAPNRYEIRYWQAVQAFADTHPANAEALRRQFGDFAVATATAGSIPTAVRDEGERRRRTLQANYQRALDEAGVDFMLVLPIGARIGPRFGGTQLPNYRTFYQLPNALTWPMVSFPIGYDGTEGLPINAAFWGPRFSEPALVQAAIDYQDRHSAYHRAAPPDPTFDARRGRPPGPSEEVVPPELSNDPLVAEGAWA
ncbi:aspartyl-tRNA(Asn)/glutamyl-tRNA(Gln) amidotransferase subunit A [Micromonospora pisi]|uniref:Aspartyl-tRNA(Asn)/glutamyl-tRNA(Gln) amidotransferase subunit A n=1 Tax=Micromonospora pisi TaxID=589240 RepID=A0A495JBV4_9ACTN|nr:amidase [Micromonospora pisi]RKR86395.1 aspartyl-tRNA(Asn)/glutamyl-tRNA(Gln) amidotransferase subunit A [Micromonospora pisi]